MRFKQPMRSAISRYGDRIGGGTNVDLFAADVKFLAVFQGPDAVGDGIVDLTGRHARTIGGSAVLSTTTKTLGASSLALLAGSSQDVTFPDSADWNDTAAGLTIEATIRRNGTPGSFYTICNQNDSVIRPWGLFVNSSGEFGVGLSSDGATADISAGTTNRGAIADLTWTHVALVHDAVGDQYRCYIAGVLTATISSSLDLHDGDGVMSIGSTGAGSLYFNGHVNAVRITANARYSNDFTPPTLADYLLSLTS